MTSSDISSMDCQVDNNMLQCEKWCYELLGVDKQIADFYYRLHINWPFRTSLQKGKGWY